MGEVEALRARVRKLEAALRDHGFRRLRSDSGKTMGEVARFLGCSVVDVSDAERNKYKEGEPIARAALDQGKPADPVCSVASCEKRASMSPFYRYCDEHDPRQVAKPANPVCEKHDWKQTHEGGIEWECQRCMALTIATQHPDSFVADCGKGEA